MGKKENEKPIDYSRVYDLQNIAERRGWFGKKGDKK